ncbi:gamma-glutamyltransferase [candidate division KSB1 bacterium]|nr:MAG: gamma-glutamyltransferase [candidate division KSB1 bacterium]
MKTRKFFLFIVLCFAIQLYPLSLSANERGDIVSGKNGMVVSVDKYASQIGIDILKKGGNAVDAAVAVGFALAVTYPSAGNIGGGGFMIIRFPDTKESVAIDFREKAPGKATPDMYLDENGKYVRKRSYYGHLAVGVPGTVKGFELAMKKYGKLSWKEVIEPAINLAENGFVLNKRMAKSFNSLKKRFKDYKEFLRIFSRPDGSDFKEGDIFVQKELAESLRLIANNGSDAFYKGKIADLIAKDMEKYGGLITKEDLEKYEAVIRKPVTGNYRGYKIISMPPPSSGGTILIEMLNILEGFELSKMERYAPETLHLISETMKFAYLDRAKYLGDSDFGKIPVDMLISKKYAESIRKRLNLVKAIPSAEIGKDILTIERANETTHYSVIDKDGIAVATTYTLNGGYGSGVVPEGTGFLLNNEMADFNMKPGYTDNKGLIGTKPNIIKPYKRMLSSMTPTIITKDGKTFMITGSPGGRTIINTVLNVIINVIDFKMNIQDAVDAPRMHHQWMPDILRIEKEGISDKVLDSLKNIGHKISTRWRQGDANSILIDPKTGIYYGAPDKRSGGTAAGY